jgi:hypothetical protein
MDEPNELAKGLTGAQWTVIALAIAVTGGALLYRFLMHENLGHSAAMFLGVPAVLAIVLALTPKAKSVTGGILKGITLALLLIAPLLGEGYVCILFAAPVFYLVGIVIGLVADWFQSKRTTSMCFSALLLAPMCMEGVIPQLTWNRMQTVEVSRVVNAPEPAVAESLSHSPQIEAKLPAFLRIGFPRPLRVSGEGLAAGSTRTIHFSGAEGDPAGDLQMKVAYSSANYVRFETVSDASKLTQWIRWESSEVRWRRVDATHTLVYWRINYDRQLDPAWYFAPWERVAVREAAKYLIAANATPQERRP